MTIGAPSLQTLHALNTGRTPVPWPRRTALWRWLSARRRALNRILQQRVATRLLTGDKPFRVLILIGQKRSGNHVFLNWFMSQYPGTSFLCNSVPPDKDPFDWHSRELRNKLGATPPVLIVSYEDHTPETVMQGPLGMFLAQHAARIVDSRLCMILRDPRNLVASRMQKWPEEFDTTDRLSRVRAGYLHNSNLVFSSPDSLLDLPFVPVLYNALIASPPYRAKLAARLAIPDGIKGLDQVPHYGHGSSFDGQNKSGRAAEMAVFARWHSFADDPRFLTVFEDPDMQNAIACFDATVQKASEPAQH